MMSYSMLQMVFLISTMTSLMIGMIPQEVSNTLSQEEEGRKAEKVGDLPKELRNEITSFLFEAQENSKYEVYKKFDVDSQVRGIALNEDNTRVLTGSDDKIARLWDVENGKLLKELKGHTDSIRSVALSAHGTLALTGSLDRTVGVWNATTGELLKRIKVGSLVFSVALSADGSTALIGSYDGSARLYNTSTGELLKELQVASAVFSVALSADGKIALTGSWDRTVRVWNTSTGELLKRLHVGPSPNFVALSADGTIAVTGTIGREVLVWDVKTGVLLNTLVTDRGSVLSVALSKDGKRVLTATTDTSIQLWNTTPLAGKDGTTTPLRVLEGHTDSAMALAFGGADLIATGSNDKTFIIWKRFSLRHLWNRQQKEVAWEAFKETFYNPESSLQQ